MLHVTVREIRLEKTICLNSAICLNSVGERNQKCDRENRGWRWPQINPIYMWYLDVVVKRLRCIKSLNYWATNYTTF